MGLALGLTAVAITPPVVTGIKRLQDRENAGLLPHDGAASGAATSSQRSSNAADSGSSSFKNPHVYF